LSEKPVTALAQTRVLDLGRVIAGPFCGQILGDMGAEVIKVEHPEAGDDTRAWMPATADSVSAYFSAVNRNKESIGIDLSAPEGREILHELAKASDILIENFRPGVTKRLGIDYETLSAINPRLVYCSISGFGQQGPMAQRAAYDYVVQAFSGVMSLTGEPDGGPVRAAGAIADYGTGLWSIIAILFALMERDRTGRGQHIDMAMQDCTMLYLSHAAAMYFADGIQPNRVGNGHEKIVPIDVYETASEPIMVLCGNEPMFQRLAAAIGRPEMASDPKFSTNAARTENLDALTTIMREVMKTDTRANWETRLAEAEIAVAPVRGIAETYAAPDVRERDMVLEIEGRSGNRFEVLGSPLKLSETPVAKNPAPPPRLAEHTDQILDRVLGIDPSRRDALREAGVIR